MGGPAGDYAGLGFCPHQEGLFMRKLFMLLLTAIFITVFASTALAGGVNLKLASFMAPNHVQHKEVIEPWAKEINFEIT